MSLERGALASFLVFCIAKICSLHACACERRRRNTATRRIPKARPTNARARKPRTVNGTTEPTGPAAVCMLLLVSLLQCLERMSSVHDSSEPSCDHSRPGMEESFFPSVTLKAELGGPLTKTPSLESLIRSPNKVTSSEGTR